MGEGLFAVEETVICKYIRPEPKDWKSVDSEKEILEESVKVRCLEN